MWPQTGAERLLYAAPSLVTEHRPPPRARAPVGGEGGPPVAQRGACDGRGQCTPEASACPLPRCPLGPQLSPQELSPPRCSPWPCWGRGPGAGPRALATPSPSAASPAYLLPLPQPQDVSHLPRKSQRPESRGVSRRRQGRRGSWGQEYGVRGSLSDHGPGPLCRSLEKHGAAMEEDRGENGQRSGVKRQ